MADYIKPVVFKVGELLYGVDINLVQSIEKQVKVVPVPNATDYIKGIVNLRNEVIPLYSLKRKFKMKDEGYTGCSIIVNTGEVKLALEVDDVIEIGDIKPENIMKMPSIIKNDNTRFMEHGVAPIATRHTRRARRLRLSSPSYATSPNRLPANLPCSPAATARTSSSPAM